MEFSTAYGDSPDFFGHKDYEAAKARGASDREILSWLSTNTSKLRGGNEPGKGGLFDQIAQGARSEEQSGPSQPAQPAPQPQQAAPDYSGLLQSYQRQLDDYRSSVDSYRTKLDETSKMYQDALAKNSTLAEERDRFRLDSEVYRNQEATSQLENLRRGSTVAGMPGSGGVDQLAAEGTRNKVAPRGASVVTEIDATDSVLNRRDPVVEVMSGGNRAQARARASRAMAQRSGPGAQSYYSRRFG